MIKKLLNSLRHIPRVNYRYTGRAVGEKTGGNYGELPKPGPLSYSVTQGPVDAFMGAIWAMWGVITISSWFGPVFLIPFWLPHKRALRDAADNYGPVRYGQSLPDIA
jgi:hypothetical protein